MTILSTDLQALKRRGYNGMTQQFLPRGYTLILLVERIERKYREQKEEQRKAVEERQTAENAKARALVSKPPGPGPVVPPGGFPEMPETTVSNIPDERSISPAVPPNHPIGRPNSTLNPFQKFTRKMGLKGTDSEDHPQGPSTQKHTPQGPQGATPLGDICKPTIPFIFEMYAEYLY